MDSAVLLDQKCKTMDKAGECLKAGRLLSVESELGPNMLLLTSLKGDDGVSRPFSFQIEVATELAASKVTTLLGKALSIQIGADALAHRRPVHGIVRKLTRLHQGIRGFQTWQAEVVPRFWFLTCTGDCRIFQNASVPDILRKVLAEHNIDHEIRGLSDDHKKLEYCVQYRESTFSFLSRLMEDAGIFYWHEHSEQKHTLVVADSNSVVWGGGGRDREPVRPDRPRRHTIA